MANINDLINLAKADGGKFFVMDEEGDVKLVILGIEEYQKLLVNKLQKQVEEVENINREILRAQMAESPVENPVIEFPKVPSPKIILQPHTRNKIIAPDLREEVIDPSFDFEAPKASFDDI